MSSHIATVAEAVKDALNAAAASSGFDTSFTAVRLWVPFKKLEDIGTDTIIQVVPRSFTRTNTSRSSVAFEYPLDIAITKKLPADIDAATEAANDTIDPLMELAEQIADFFAHGIFESSSEYEWLRTEIPDPIYHVDRLREDRVFISVITATFIKP